MMNRNGKVFLIGFLAALFGVLIVICSAFLITALTVTIPEGHVEGNAEVQNIRYEENCTETKAGRVTVYQNGDAIYQYDGPLKVDHLNGKHDVTIQTERCSCFEGRDAE